MPLFGALRDVALVGCDTDVPARLGKILAEQLPPSLLAGRHGYELARTSAPVVGDRHHAPQRTERHAARRDRRACDVGSLSAADREHLHPIARGNRPDTPGEADRADDEPCGPRSRTEPLMNDRRRRLFRLRRRRWRPRGVAIRRRERRPRARLPASPQDDPERYERHDDDHRFLEPDAGGVRQEDGQREPDDVEREVQDDAGEQTEVKVEEAESDRRDDELDGTRKRGLCRIRRVSRAEDDGLYREGDDDEQLAFAESVADERCAGDWNRAEQALFPEPRLERVGNRRQPRHVRREDIGVEQCLRWRPPAEHTRRDDVESDVVGEEHRHEQEAGGGAGQDGRRTTRALRPHVPELRVRSERTPCERLRRHERQRHERREADERRHERRHLTGDEGPPRHGRVVGHPHQRPLVEGRQGLQRADDGAPDRGLSPQHVAAAQHEEEADADAADHVEEHHADDRADADGFVS